MMYSGVILEISFKSMPFFKLSQLEKFSLTVISRMLRTANVNPFFGKPSRFIIQVYNKDDSKETKRQESSGSLPTPPKQQCLYTRLETSCQKEIL